MKHLGKDEYVGRTKSPATVRESAKKREAVDYADVKTGSPQAVSSNRIETFDAAISGEVARDRVTSTVPSTRVLTQPEDGDVQLPTDLEFSGSKRYYQRLRRKLSTRRGEPETPMKGPDSQEEEEENTVGLPQTESADPRGALDPAYAGETSRYARNSFVESSAVGFQSPQPTAERRDDVDYPVDVDRILRTIWRRRIFILLISSCVAILAVFFTFLQGPRYTATTLLQIDPSIEFGDVPGAPAGPNAVSELIEARATLLRSMEFSRQVAQRLLTLPQETEDPPSRIEMQLSFALDAIKGIEDLFPHQRTPVADVDDAADRLRSNLSVDLDRRSNIISLSFRSRSPERAAEVANVYGSEYVTTSASLKTTRQLALEQETLRSLRERYGERHPLVITSREKISLLHREFQSYQESQPILSPEDLRATGQVVPAQPTTIPSSPGSIQVALAAFFIGTLLALLLVLIIDRRKLRSAGRSLQSSP